MIDSEFRNSIEPHMQLNSIYYEHNIELKNPLVSRFELSILTVLSVCLPIYLIRDEYVITNKCKGVHLLLCVTTVIFFLRKLFWGVKKESVFIIKSLGLQATVTYYSNLKSSKFIPWHLIDDVIINEAILMQRVIYYLAVLIKSEEKNSWSYQNKSILPLFLHAKPRLSALKEIYCSIQEILQS